MRGAGGERGSAVTELDAPLVALRQGKEADVRTSGVRLWKPQKTREWISPRILGRTPDFSAEKIASGLFYAKRYIYSYLCVCTSLYR